MEFTAEENKPNVILDGCKAKRAESKTVFEVIFIFKNTFVIVFIFLFTIIIFHIMMICVMMMMMQVRTEKLGELPLVDFYPVDYGQQQQAFGFEVRRIIIDKSFFNL